MLLQHLWKESLVFELCSYKVSDTSVFRIEDFELSVAQQKLWGFFRTR